MTGPAERAGSDGFTARADRVLQGLVGGRQLTPLVGVLAVLLAMAVGRRPRRAARPRQDGDGRVPGRQARPAPGTRSAVAATVTLTHTGGVLVLGLLLTTASALAGERVLGWLGVVSGLTVAAVGAAMLLHARRSRRPPASPPRTITGTHHDHARTTAVVMPRPRGLGRWGIVGMGVAGGLVPSPSALVILLGAIGLGRTGFGVLLVLAYGVGMAVTLTAAGFALIQLRRRWGGRLTRLGARWTRLRGLAPAGTAALVLLVGIGLAGRALAGLG